MSQPPGKIKEVFMDHNTWIELENIRTALTGSVGVLLVLADGLDGYTGAEALSGDHAMAYVGVLSSACHMLSDIDRRLGEMLERGPVEREGETGASA